MIQCYTNPLLLDFIKVCIRMPQDERDQLEAFTGEKYDIDGAAVGNFTAPGPKWVIKADEEPIMVGGFVPVRPGVYRDFALTTPDAWAHWFPVTRIARRAMDAMLSVDGPAHRLECMAPAVRLAYRPQVEKWYSALKYKREALLSKYCADGSDAVLFSRVRQ